MAAQRTPSDYYAGPIMDRIWPESKALLTKYSNIPADELEEHVRTIRDRAWKISPYPCIALFLFLRLDLAQHPAYAKVLELLRGAGTGQRGMVDQPRYLELACCVGQNIRKLISDGISASALYGSDLQPEFLDLGFDLFRDRDSFPPGPTKQFFPADLLTADSVVEGEEGMNNPWSELEGRFRVINASSFLHLFDYQTQVRACCIIARLLERRAGSVFTGSQLGRSEPGEIPRSDLHIRGQDGGRYTLKTRYLHSPSSFSGLWGEVGRRTGITFHVEAQIHPIRRPEGSAESTTPRPAVQDLRNRLGTNEILVFTVTVLGGD